MNYLRKHLFRAGFFFFVFSYGSFLHGVELSRCALGLLSSQQHILIVDADQNHANVLATQLREEGYKVSLAHDSRSGLEQAQSLVPNLVILELSLPEIDGFSLIARLQKDPLTHSTRIVILSDRTEELDQLVGLALGADDFVPKPYNALVLSHRLQAIFRRFTARASASNQEVIEKHGIRIDSRRHEVYVDGNAIRLSSGDFALLEYLMRRPGIACTRLELLKKADREENTLRAIDVHIKTIRRALGDKRELIETVRGIGYRFRE